MFTEPPSLQSNTNRPRLGATGHETQPMCTCRGGTRAEGAQGVSRTWEALRATCWVRGKGEADKSPRVYQ